MIQRRFVTKKQLHKSSTESYQLKPHYYSTQRSQKTKANKTTRTLELSINHWEKIVGVLEQITNSEPAHLRSVYLQRSQWFAFPSIFYRKMILFFFVSRGYFNFNTLKDLFRTNSYNKIIFEVLACTSIKTHRSGKWKITVKRLEDERKNKINFQFYAIFLLPFASSFLSNYTKKKC